MVEHGRQKPKLTEPEPCLSPETVIPSLAHEEVYGRQGGPKEVPELAGGVREAIGLSNPLKRAQRGQQGNGRVWGDGRTECWVIDLQSFPSPCNHACTHE